MDGSARCRRSSLRSLGGCRSWSGGRLSRVVGRVDVSGVFGFRSSCFSDASDASKCSLVLMVDGGKKKGRQEGKRTGEGAHLTATINLALFEGRQSLRPYDFKRSSGEGER